LFAKVGEEGNTIPYAHDSAKKRPPTMLVTDLSLRYDPTYAKISKRFLEHPGEFEKTFARNVV